MDILIFAFGTVVTLIVGGALVTGIVANNHARETTEVRAPALPRRRTG